MPFQQLLFLASAAAWFAGKKQAVYSTQDSKWFSSVQFSLVAQSCPALCGPMDCSTPGLPVHHQLPELAQTHAHWVSDAIQPSHPLSSPFPPTLNLSQHQGLFHWVSSSHQVAKVAKVIGSNIRHGFILFMFSVIIKAFTVCANQDI